MLTLYIANCSSVQSGKENGNFTRKCCSGDALLLSNSYKYKQLLIPGLCVDLLRKFEEDLGFTYELVRAVDPKWGTLEVGVNNLPS